MEQRPEWLNVKAFDVSKMEAIQEKLTAKGLHTVCEEALCPNIGECFNHGTATFMILGNICTRHCAFCGVKKGQKLLPPDPDEPLKVAESVKKMNLKYVVITSVTRDDLEDGGAMHFAKTIEAIKQLNPQTGIEVLIPDFLGNREALEKVVKAKPKVINHNIETIPVLYHTIRPEADYKRSLNLLKQVKELDKTIYTKSGIMVGLGETQQAVKQVMNDLRDVNCDIFTIGQYLRPTPNHYPVKEYVTPELFTTYEQWGKELGFKFVAAGSFVRSSYQAQNAFK